LTNFFVGRTDRVIGHLKGAGLYPYLSTPSYNQHGATFSNEFMLTISAPVGSIYYTTNGTDPRLPGGGIAPGAALYSGPITLNSSRRVLARTFHTNVWSAMNDAVFIETTPIPLRITEIMFNPREPLTGTNVSEDFEYVEVKNISAAPLSLAGMKFARGITFAFSNVVLQARQHAVIVKNLAAFESRYGTGINVVGQFIGSLSDDGENIRLEGPLGETIHRFEYDDWFPLADGLGFSMVIANENQDRDLWSEREGWRVSSVLGGSPGADDPVPNIPAIRVNEALTHTDLPQVDTVELYNPTGSTVDIGGWFLTDDARDPKKYRIPNGTTITTGGYLVLDEGQFNAPGSGFSLSSHGEEIYLYSGDANTNLTGYAHGFSFGAAANGVSFGRYVVSTGEEQFPAQTAYTPGATNSGPIIGPVVLTEIMYNPPPGGDEFVEFKNISTNSVPMFHVSYPSNTWTIDGLSFSFPPGVLLAPGEIALAVSGNTTAFRNRYNVPASVQIFSFGGSLQDNGETIQLQRPDIPDGDFIPFVTVDAVRYNDRGPWPRAADGVGPSLQKRVAGVYGNDPIAWTAAIPTPGAEFSGGQPPVIVAHPASQNSRGGTNVTLSVLVSGDAPFFYQWNFNGDRIPGSTNSSLLLPNVQPANSGTYSVVVYSTAGSAISSNAYLSVLTPPTITAPPTNVTVRLPNPAATTNVTFRVTAAGAASGYQWFYNGSPIPGANTAILMLPDAGTSAGGTYTVEVSDQNGWSYSSATLLVLVHPAIIEQPQTQVAVVGDNVNIRLKVVGTEPFGLRWRRNGVSIFPGSGYTSFREITLTNVQTSNAGIYSVIITNAANPAPGIASSNATLTVLIDSDGDHIPDVWESFYGFATNAPNDALIDTDGDSMNNLQEYLAGTDPRDPESYLKVDQISVSGTTLLTFLARSNKTYTVQYNSDLSSSGWSNMVNALSRPTNRIETVTDPLPPPRRYYRLVTPGER